MARKPPPEAYRFKPGRSGNPEGSRLHNPAFKAARKLTQGELADIMLFVSNASLSELKKMAEDPNTPTLQVAVLKCFSVMVKKGDANAFDKLMNRMVGMVKQVVEVKNPEGEAFRTQNMTLEEIRAERAAIEARRNARRGT